MAFLVEIDEILSNSVPKANNPIPEETKPIIASDDHTTLERRHSWQIGDSAFPTRDSDTVTSQVQETSPEGHKIKEMKDLQSVLPVNPKSEAASEDQTSLKPRRYVSLLFKWHMLKRVLLLTRVVDATSDLRCNRETSRTSCLLYACTIIG
jgi:hypothetical protein